MTNLRLDSSLVTSPTSPTNEFCVVARDKNTSQSAYKTHECYYSMIMKISPNKQLIMNSRRQLLNKFVTKVKYFY